MIIKNKHANIYNILKKNLIMNTSDLELFIRITENGSITATAQQLNMSPAAVSLALKRLEKQLDLQLFIRSTRKISITKQGELFLLHCRNALDALEEGRISALHLQGVVAGELNLSSSSDLGRNLVLSWLDEMLELHPNLTVNFNINDSLSDFYSERIDVALRYGEPEDSSMIAFHIATLDRVLCASPDYIAQFGTPLSPADLHQHQCLIHRIGGQLFDQWIFSKEANGEDFKIKVQGKRTSNDTDIVHRWALAGKGLMFRARIDVTSDLHSGKLRQLLPDFKSPPLQLYLICPNRRKITPAVIMLRERLREKCKMLLGTTKY